MSKSLSDPKTIIGSEEWCAFPALGVPAIKARVDSGAKTSAIHAFNVHTFKRNGDTWVSFEVHPLQNDRRTVIRCERQVVDRRVIKSSSGSAEKRYIISERLHLDGREWDVELTLANRDSMGYRMLLGREAMAGRMMVDPEMKFCLGEPTADELDHHYGKKNLIRSGLKIGLLASDPSHYSNRRIMEACEERGHRIEFIDISQCYAKLDAVDPEAHHRAGKVVEDLDAIVTRIGSERVFYGCALARQFESMDVLTVNDASSIERAGNLLYSLQLMVKSGVAIPTTGFANSPMDTSDLVDLVGGAPLVVKWLEGDQGRGAVLAETRKSAESAISAFKALDANLLVQRFVKEAAGKDLRCFVIDGKVVAAVQREGTPGELRTHRHQGGSIKVAKITPEERAMAIKAAKVLGLNFAGVDIIRSYQGPQLLSVNAAPDLEGIETTTGKDIASVMIAAIEKKLGWKRALSSVAEETG